MDKGLYEETIKKYNIIQVGKTGSQLYGLAGEDSDTDLIGIYIEPIERVVGFSSDDTSVVRSAALRECKIDAESKSGDLDFTLYSLRKFLTMVYVGNPNIVSQIFLKGDSLVLDTTLGKEMRNMASTYLLSKNILRAGYGMCKSQRTIGLGTGREKRDAKALATALTHAYNLEAFQKNGSMSFPLTEGQLANMKVARAGNDPLDVVDRIDEILSKIDSAIKQDDHWLRDKPDMKQIERWMIDVYQREWAKTS